MAQRRPVLLQHLATASGFTVSSLADLCSSDKTTIHRLWRDPEWPEKMRSSTSTELQGLVPGISEYLQKYALDMRYEAISKAFARGSVPLDVDKHLDALADSGVPPQIAASCLEAVGAVMNGDLIPSVRRLRPLWGRVQTRALDIIFGSPGSDEASKEMLDASERMLGRLFRSNSNPEFVFARAIAMAHLAHHLGKHGRYIDGLDQESIVNAAPARTTRLSFAARGAFMGRLRTTDDLDLALRYDNLVQASYVLKEVEQWAFPTWAGDVANGEKFEVSESLRLRRTSIEIIREVREYNDAYVLYLIKTYVPLALNYQDREFGGNLEGLAEVLRYRLESTNVPEIRSATVKLLKQIPESD